MVRNGSAADLLEAASLRVVEEGEVAFPSSSGAQRPRGTQAPAAGSIRWPLSTRRDRGTRRACQIRPCPHAPGRECLKWQCLSLGCWRATVAMNARGILTSSCSGRHCAPPLMLTVRQRARAALLPVKIKWRCMMTNKTTNTTLKSRNFFGVLRAFLVLCAVVTVARSLGAKSGNTTQTETRRF